jgi:hypothetical protein
VTAVPAQYGPDDGEADTDGFVNWVAGLSSALPKGGASMSTLLSRPSARSATVWAPSSTESCSAAKQASRLSLGGSPFSLAAKSVAAAAGMLDATHVVVAGQDGWAHFTQVPNETRSAFRRAGLQDIFGDDPLGCRDTGNGEIPPRITTRRQEKAPS